MKKYSVFVFLLFIIVFLTACDQEQVGHSDKSSVSVRDPLVEILEAQNIYEVFLEDYPDLEIKALKLEKKGNDFIYKVKGSNEKQVLEVKYDAKQAQLLKEEADDWELHPTIVKKDLQHISSLVLQTQADLGPAYNFSSWSLENDDQVFVLEVKFKNSKHEYEYKYDLQSQKLLEIDS